MIELLKESENKYETMVNEHIALITIDAKGLAEAKERAGRFLIASAILVAYLKETEIRIAKLKPLEKSELYTAILASDGKNATQQKDAAQTNSAYIEAREALEEGEAQRTWIKGNIAIFDNAHVLFRQYSRD